MGNQLKLEDLFSNKKALNVTKEINAILKLLCKIQAKVAKVKVVKKRGLKKKK